ncbi:dihydropteroate synthase [Paenibacillus aurantius]|uniref:Dihydropteroate synthase n=1 Tax=Paenibacillus aurantius TaxID=2918900 RepID=A0AA96LHU2_9BACL|nr:dihydropteroate synthase [Paenibacillus aurantius]WNQ11702.1 dihydropteroate synthase [Paenibacillus aurantius]
MNTSVRRIPCGSLTLELGARTQIMGILNITPDSFSDGGRYTAVEDAVRQAKLMVNEGADILDIGGESTRPGAEPVSAEEELNRVIPVLEALKEASLSVPISIDTYKAEVARKALEAGAHIINDVWGFKRDPAMARTAAEYDCPVILMHNRTDTTYSNFLEDVAADLKESIRLAREAGVKEERIILDPGIGFAKSYEQNLYLMNSLHTVRDLGYPVLLATSRKRSIQRTLDLPADEVVEGTIATVVLGIAQGCEIVRVHDVRPNKKAAVMADAIVRSHSTCEVRP